MKNLYQEYGTQTILTRGKYPTLYFDGKQIHFLSPQINPEPVNVIGCGDAFTAGFAVSILHNDTIKDAIKQGHECAFKNSQFIKPGNIISE